MVVGGYYVRVLGGLHSILRGRSGHDVPQDPQLATFPRDSGGDRGERLRAVLAVSECRARRARWLADWETVGEEFWTFVYAACEECRS